MEGLIMLDVTMIYIICTMLGIGGILILFVALWLAHQNRAVLARMPCPACRHLFGKKAVEKLFQNPNEAAYAEEQRRLMEKDIFSKETYARAVLKWPIQCPACGIQCHYYPFEPLITAGKMKRYVFPLLEKTESYKETDQFKL